MVASDCGPVAMRTRAGGPHVVIAAEERSRYSYQLADSRARFDLSSCHAALRLVNSSGAQGLTAADRTLAVSGALPLTVCALTAAPRASSWGIGEISVGVVRDLSRRSHAAFRTARATGGEGWRGSRRSRRSVMGTVRSAVTKGGRLPLEGRQQCGAP
jgi:hypothetical protein